MSETRIRAPDERARAVLARVENEERSVTDEEKAEVQAIIERIKQLKDDAEMLSEIDKLRAGRPSTLEGFRPGVGTTVDGTADAWASKIAESAVDLDAGKFKPMAAITVPSPLAPASPSTVEIQRLTTVASLFPVRATTATEESIMQQTVRTNNAAPVAHGAAKPESVYISGMMSEAGIWSNRTTPLGKRFLTFITEPE